MIRCDEECLKVLRNRQLADALKIDPDTHVDNHIPYSDTTLKMYRENANFAQTQEREFRVFAGSDEKRLRFKPMPAHQRAFLHSLAEDYGLDSESQDPDPHRHVCVFKTPRFVSAPKKTLAQCVRIVQAAATPAAKPATPADSRPQEQPYNALLLSTPRFGLTIEEIDRALATEIAAAARSGLALTFVTSFLPSEDVIIKAVTKSTAAAIATSLVPPQQAVESAVSSLKPGVSKVISRLGLAKNVLLCHADSSLNILRREGDLAANTGGWSAVASRGSWKRTVPGKPAAAAPAGGGGLALGRAGGAFVALRRLELKKKKEEEERKKEVVEDDWEAAAEKLEDVAGGSGSGSEMGKENMVEISEDEDMIMNDGQHSREAQPDHYEA